MENVHHGLLDHQIAVLIVAGAQENNVRLPQRGFEGDEVGIAHVGIGANDAAALE